MTNTRKSIARAARTALALSALAFALAVPSAAQERTRRYVPSLTSEDLLNRPSAYTPPPDAPTARPASAGAPASAASAGASYRDPSGAFTLTFPNGDWRVNGRAGSAGRAYNQRSFRRIDPEGFASATANVYVLTERANVPVADPAALAPEAQRGLAEALAARFLSSNASLVSVEPVLSKARYGLRIVADQSIGRRVAVRASINVFGRGGRLYVVVCSAPLETFDASAREFDAITNSLASSVARS